MQLTDFNDPGARKMYETAIASEAKSAASAENSRAVLMALGVVGSITAGPALLIVIWTAALRYVW